MKAIFKEMIKSVKSTKMRSPHLFWLFLNWNNAYVSDSSKLIKLTQEQTFDKLFVSWFKDLDLDLKDIAEPQKNTAPDFESFLKDYENVTVDIDLLMETLKLYKKAWIKNIKIWVWVKPFDPLVIKWENKEAKLHSIIMPLNT